MHGSQKEVDVLIIGGGHAGMNVADCLSHYPLSIAVVDAGVIGVGAIDINTGTPGPMPLSGRGPHHTKMVLTADDNFWSNFLENLGEKDTFEYFKMKRFGSKMLQQRAAQLDPALIRLCDSLILATTDGEEDLLKEEQVVRNLMENLGEDMGPNPYSVDMLNRLYGVNKGIIVGSLSIPGDAIINSSGYVCALARSIIDKGYTVVEKSKVVRVAEETSYVRVTIQPNVPGINGQQHDILAKYVVVATNGFWEDKFLRGRVRPLWTFQVLFEDPGPNTPNASNIINSDLYFSRQDNVMIVGGKDCEVEDNFSVPLKLNERVADLEKDCTSVFKRFALSKKVARHWAVFTKTKDRLPLVGQRARASRVFYCLGCNGNGQSTYRYSSYLLSKQIAQLHLNQELLTGEELRQSYIISPVRKGLR